ncbi:MAG: ABC-2 family transporter protein [Patescibacteria group bacterium]
MSKVLKYIKIWWLMSKNAFISILYTKLTLVVFLLAKIIRFSFFIAFLYFLLKGTNSLAGYNLNQTLFFFLTFTVVDTISQFLFREVYRFRPQIVSGSFDLVLSKPFNALFRSLLGGADVIDLITIPPLIYALVYVGALLQPNFIQVVIYIALLLNGLLISTAFHIAVLAMAILTLEIDHTIMIYRDVISLGRFPVDIYKEPLKGILTYLIPVGLMVTLPAKFLIGMVTIQGALLSFLLCFVFLFASVSLWNSALRYYTSASS